MKKSLLLFAFILASFSFYGQSNTGITVNNNPFYQLSIQQTNTFDFSQAYSKNAPFALSVYNKTTGLNDSYFSTGNTYSFSKSVPILSNQFRETPIDSFNPYGSTNFGSAILLGVINSLF